MNPQFLLPYIVPVVVLGLLYFRMRKMPARPVNMTALWLLPLIVTLGIGSALWFVPHPAFDAADYAFMAAALAVGVGFGVLRARTLTLRRCPETGRVLMETSTVTFIVLAGLFLLRSALRTMTGSLGAVAVDASMLFAFGMIVTQQVLIWQRARAIPTLVPSPPA